jgi:hypothetical protein
MGDMPDRKTPVLQDCWGLGVGLTIPPLIKKKTLRNLRKQKPDRSAKDDTAKV